MAPSYTASCFPSSFHKAPNLKPLVLLTATMGAEFVTLPNYAKKVGLKRNHPPKGISIISYTAGANQSLERQVVSLGSICE